ncbi:EAL domain-containing protein [Oceanospirillum sp.]|uniref:EAL domain-containing protein n=1 Tax=Oceanospirillum sp. TaxID=2021254 RepID=UPI003A8F6386
MVTKQYLSDSHLSAPEHIRQLGIHPNRIGRDQGRFFGHFSGYALHSHYQPIISLTHQRTVGYEALMRPFLGQTLESPLALFARCHTPTQICHLDRISRALHLMNFRQLGIKDGWLFLNIRGEEIRQSNMDAAGIRRTLAEFGFQPGQIVLEILEDAVHDEMLLAEFVQEFRNAGFLVAIDDFGTGQSNFDRIWKINPNIVKLDRSMVRNAHQQPRARRIFPRLVSLLRETESLVLIEGIENQDEALLAMDTDADMVQGFYFARPTADGQAHHDLPSTIDNLHKEYASHQRQRRVNFQSQLTTFENLMTTCADLLRQEQSFEQSSKLLLEQEGCRRIFLLDGDGCQITRTIAPTHTENNNPYHPLKHAQGANWARRKYFQRAIESPDRVCISRPYLALPDASIDVTFAIAFKHNNKRYVLCCDVDSRYIDAAGNLLQQGRMISQSSGSDE